MNLKSNVQTAKIQEQFNNSIPQTTESIVINDTYSQYSSNIYVFPSQNQNQNLSDNKKQISGRLTFQNHNIKNLQNNININDSNINPNNLNERKYVKNYFSISKPGRDSNREKKINQDNYFCKTNINNIKNFNIFFVLDGHGPFGHNISEFVSKFIPSKIVNHPEIQNLQNTEEIYQKLNENNFNIISAAFISADKQLENNEE